ncbi:sialidase family protein [Actinomadura rugatobispora]|uniref:Sialidase family protein n=1 Tax=Actinomadura rugatobispora TaxID=1994 RepID=A0ABW1AGV5_9ACTN|nr:sialidase family protein [Actinomadura rugatobispora]
MRKSLPVLAAPVIALLPVSAAVADGGERSRLSGDSPFSGCAPGALDAEKADGAIEPTLAADPSDPRRIAAVWPQDHHRGVVAAVTRDGGRTWKRSVVRGLTRCSGGRYDYVDDPMATFTRDGGLVVTAGVDMADGSASAALSVRSDDGRAWTRPSVILEEPDPRQGVVAAGQAVPDPRDPDVLYVVGPRFPAEARTRNQGWISRSTDGGRTWTPPRIVVEPAEGSMATGHRLTVLGDGTLLDLHTHIRFRGGPGLSEYSLQAVRSTDGGATWSAPRKIADMRSRITIQDPETGDHVSHTTSLLSDTAIDPRTGRLYAVWQDARFGGGAADGVALTSSGDGGRTWTEPIKVNRTPTTIPAGDQQAFTVSAAVGRDGTLAVSYSDFRHNGPGTPLLTDRWLARCRPVPGVPCTGPTAKWRENRLTTRSFDMRRAPRIPDASSPRGFFVGEQMGLVATGHGFTSTWSAPDAPACAAAHVRTTP